MQQNSCPVSNVLSKLRRITDFVFQLLPKSVIWQLRAEMVEQISKKEMSGAAKQTAIYVNIQTDDLSHTWKAARFVSYLGQCGICARIYGSGRFF